MLGVQVEPQYIREFKTAIKRLNLNQIFFYVEKKRKKLKKGKKKKKFRLVSFFFFFLFFLVESMLIHVNVNHVVIRC